MRKEEKYFRLILGNSELGGQFLVLRFRSGKRRLIDKFHRVQEISRELCVKLKPHSFLCLVLFTPTHFVGLSSIVCLILTIDEVVATDSRCAAACCCGMRMRLNANIMTHVKSFEGHCIHCSRSVHCFLGAT